MTPPAKRDGDGGNKPAMCRRPRAVPPDASICLLAAVNLNATLFQFLPPPLLSLLVFMAHDS
jgi:hypothetical protein